MSNKCQDCKLNNVSRARRCVRCKTVLTVPRRDGSIQGRSNRVNGLAIVRRVTMCVFACVAALLTFYASLILSSSPLSADQQKTIDRAIGILEKKGFYEEVYYLRNFASFRGSDNWLNSLAPKENAYAATNYPFEIMTVYPEFFTYPEDDIERAAILLHEAQHLRGIDEKGAYEYVWRNRSRIGWTKDKYKWSVLWKNVRQQTKEYAPNLFVCDFNEFDDCTKGI